MVRKITCRFNKKENLDEFNEITGLALSNLTKEFSFVTFTKTDKKPSNRKPKESKNVAREEYWFDMPHYVQNNYKPYATIDFLFEEDTAIEIATKIFDQHITDKTKSVWFRKLDTYDKMHTRIIGGDNPKYPIYIVSKGRYHGNMCLTATFLNRMEVPHFIVVEPDEVSLYQKMVDDEGLKYSTILELNMEFKKQYQTLDDLGETKGKGPGGARNFCWYDSIRRGFSHHWVMDDNIRGFWYLTNNSRMKCRTGVIFKATEDFGERFKNTAIISLNYKFFVPEIDANPPFITNTRMYSIMLINNDIPYTWRGRWNEAVNY